MTATTKRNITVVKKEIYFKGGIMTIYKIHIDNRPFKEVVIDNRSDDIFKDIVRENWKDLEDYNYTITVIENNKTVEEITL